MVRLRPFSTVALAGALALGGCTASGVGDGPDANLIVHNQADLLLETTRQSPLRDAATTTRATARFALRTLASDDPAELEPFGSAPVKEGCQRDGASALPDPGEGSVRFVDVGARAIRPSAEAGDARTSLRIPLVARQLPDVSERIEGTVFVSRESADSTHGSLRGDLELLLEDGTTVPLGSAPEAPVLAREGLVRSSDGSELYVHVEDDQEFSALLASDSGPALRCHFGSGRGVIPLPVDFAGGTLEIERTRTTPLTLRGVSEGNTNALFKGTARLVARTRMAVAASELKGSDGSPR